MTRGELTHELAAVLPAQHEARFIVEEVCGPAGSTSGPLDPTAVDAARALAGRRCAGEPLQYVFGHWSFRALDLLVDPRVLIPRPETEQVVEVALAELADLAPERPVLVDAGTGSGAIALALATELHSTGGRVVALDASAAALAVAAQNVDRVGARHPMLPVTLREGHWLDALPPDLRGTVTLVVANPPYVSAAEWVALGDRDVVRREPRRALVAGPARDGTPGLADVETVLTQARDWLARPGTVVIELAPHQAAAAAVLAGALGYAARVEPDLARRPRALVGRLA